MDEIPEGWNQELYEKLSFEYLIECAENKNIHEWNALYLEYLESEWKRLYPDRKWDPENVFELVMRWPDFKKPTFFRKDFREVRSRGVYFARAHLEGADFMEAHLEGADFRAAHLERANFIEAHLDSANFIHAHLNGVYFIDARLDGAYFIKARLDGASCMDARLEGANFMDARLEGANFREAHLERAIFRNTHLERAIFINARLEWADFRVAHLGRADFSGAHLEGAKFIYSIVDGETLFTENAMDGKTDFTGTGISATRIDPVLRTKLEKNIREIQWNDWYKNHRFLRIIMRPFWFLTDYGASTIRPVSAFVLWNTLFAIIYYLWLGNDFEELMTPYTSPFLTNIGDNIVIFLTDWMKSNLMIISLTDMATIELGLWTLFAVFLHVFVGYFILAALVARLSIMFQNLSPNDN